jgi:hypothetical protein
LFFVWDNPFYSDVTYIGIFSALSSYVMCTTHFGVEYEVHLTKMHM